jgi:peptidyl-prolyl cis-trans isomerase SurA
MQSNLIRSVLLLSVILLAACSTGNNFEKGKGSKIGEVNGKPIYFEDVWNEYMKSNTATQDSITLDNFKSFSDLYLDYKSKIAAAEVSNYFKDSTIVQELTNYETQYAMPYWLEKDIEKRLLDEIVIRSKDEIKVSHILIELLPNALPSDTLSIYNQLMSAKAKAENGANFDSLSAKTSSYRDGRSMGGSLGYMSAAWAVKPFEDMAYNTPVGKISMPFKTQFGMHILLVQDRRPKTMDRMISHVFWRSGGNKVKQDSMIAVANELRNNILAGTSSWDSVVVNYTEDGLSKKNAGKIGWVEPGKYMQAFNDSAFAIKKKGDITLPFYSGYGVHLLKLDSVRTYKDEEAQRAELLSRLKNLPRYKNNKEATYSRLRDISKASKNNKNAQLFYDFIKSDSVIKLMMTEVIVPKSLASTVLFSMRGTNFSTNEFMAFLKKKNPKQTASSYRYQMLDEFINEKTAEFLVPMTKEQFPEFRKTTEEYKNGLVVFKISEDSVWNYVKTDTTNLIDLYNQDPSRFWFEKRYSYWRISTQNDSLLTAIQLDLNNGTSVDSLKKWNKNIFMLEDVIADTSEEPFYRLEKLEERKTTEVFEYKKRKTILYLEEILEPRQMTFNEAFFRVVAEYQPIREKKWLESLRNQFKAVSLSAELERSFNEKKASL